MNVSRRHFGLLAALLMFGLTFAGIADAGSRCLNKEHLLALNTRALLTDFEVASLTCKNGDDYNQFVNSHRKFLLSQSKVMQGFFSRRGGRKAMNGFITDMANDLSLRSLREGPRRYCKRINRLYSATRGKDAKDMLKLVDDDLFQIHGYSGCGDRQASLANPANDPASIR